MRQFVKFISVFVFPLFLPLTTSAQSFPEQMLMATPWQELEGGRVRIDLEPHGQNGHFSGVIEINLKPDWKTYWKNPGNSGMEPVFYFDEPVNYQIFFPLPRLFKDGDDWSIGYKNNVLLPFVIEENKNNAHVSGHLTIGLCKEICVPLDLPFDFSNKSNMQAAPTSLLALARKKLPQQTPRDIKILANDDGKAVTIRITHPENQEISALFLDGKSDEIGPAEIINQHPQETIFRAPIISKTGTTPLTITYSAEAKPDSFTGTVISQKK